MRILYQHLESFAVSSGPVHRGDVIAYSGNTPRTDNKYYHLHLEMMMGVPDDKLNSFSEYNASYTSIDDFVYQVDPLKYIPLW